MKEHIKHLARYRIARAREIYNDAITLINKVSLLSACNRLYYAGFYAARALLTPKQLDSSKPSEIISLFQQHFVKTGIIDADIARVFPRSFEKRLNADYEDFATFTFEEIEMLSKDVLKFISSCEEKLTKILEEDERI